MMADASVVELRKSYVMTGYSGIMSELAQARYFNGTFNFNAYNATTLATVTGAFLFIALNTAFATLFLNPKAKSSKKSEDELEAEYQYAYYDYDQTQRQR